MTMLNKTIGFIGAGNMAEAIIGALLKSDITTASMITACDINADRLDSVKSLFGIQTSNDIRQTCIASDIIVLAVKPQVMDTILDSVEESVRSLSEKKLFISVAAGISLNKFETSLYRNLSEAEQTLRPVIRVMPNTPGLVLAGMTAICANRNVSETEMTIAETIFTSMGRILIVSEDKMDAVTAISGSGPAYFFYMVESMVDAAQSVGLTSDEAFMLTLTTMEGAAKLLRSSDDDPATLRRKVTSPGGTTEAALNSFEKNNFRDIIKKAVSAAENRSKELS